MVHIRKYAPLYILFISWLVINLIQAACIGVDGDEAYYWMFSKHLDWGYFDHPPFVALLITIGEQFGHGPFFTRLGTVIFSTATAFLIFIGLPDTLKQVKYFAWLFPSILIFNVYGFITTPDAPLFFFSALFFLAYKRYLEQESFSTSILLSIAITGMFYSKYHGILPVLFVVLSNPLILKRKSFWLIASMVLILFSPHVYWQYQHDWPTVRFHLFERGLRIYKINFTLDYILGQLLIWGPFVSVFFYWKIFKIKWHDKLIKAHLFNFMGVLFTFLLSSFKNHVEAHWTLVAGTSFVVLFMSIIDQGNEKRKLFFLKLAKLNIVLIFFIRIILLIPGVPLDKINNYKPFVFGKSWADSIYKHAGTTPVIFTNSYILPSIYHYYHPNTTSLGYSTKYYRKTQYSINDAEYLLNGKKVLWFNDTASVERQKIHSPFKSGNLVPINPYRSVNGLKVEANNLPESLRTDDTADIEIIVKNTGMKDIINDGQISISYSFSKYSYVVDEGAGIFQIQKTIIPPGYEMKVPIKLIAPAKKGATRLLFSINNGMLSGNFASPYYKINIE